MHNDGHRDNTEVNPFQQHDDQHIGRALVFIYNLMNIQIHH
jgi:hypothetical protein